MYELIYACTKSKFYLQLSTSMCKSINICYFDSLRLLNKHEFDSNLDKFSSSSQILIMLELEFAKNLIN